MGTRYHVKSATLSFNSTSYEMASGPAAKGQTKEAVDVTALSDSVKQFIPGALVEDDEVCGWRVLFEERDGVDVLAVEVGVDGHHLLQEVSSRCDPVHAEPSAEVLLEALDELERHQGLAGADGGFEHHGLEAALGEAPQAFVDCIFLILAKFVFHIYFHLCIRLRKKRRPAP